MAAGSANAGRHSWRRTILLTIGVLALGFVAIQFIPYGRHHSNPPATNPFIWSDPQAEAIARKSCYDCHSNETRWWWATKIAPVSWLVQHDVSDGRASLNFSDWSGAVGPAELARSLDNMPPLQYALIHAGAKLTPSERQTLVAGLEASLGGNQSSSATPAPGPTTASDPQATAIIQSRCGSCHSSDVALYYRAGSASEAQALIDQMIQQGASLTPAEQKVLVSYFTA